MSTLGIIHTALSVLPILFGLWAFLRDGRINPGTRVGGLYLLTMVASIVTSFGLSRAGGFNPGHALGIFALVLMGLAVLAPRLGWLGNGAPYVQTLAMSASFLVLLIPGTVETLTRLPAGQPLATGPESPAVQGTLGVLLVLFLVGTAFQVVRLRTGAPRTAAPLAREP
ncbi:hypothetical protein JY651_13870 [Pyxidicoccus parkwayensis]|uniref:DUF2306 domain-containing protein n=1 Tax=Pyxidicoccus parkwayensis TaxID=2813578 RepID=A0ABX7P670_9BACT|nr:hypothetical protein [Pyxidicoccus parkwaysis]QSQ25946.1 hypothetical protein JY651_13870 [Pyxidicoccus parkwaysis]